MNEPRIPKQLQIEAAQQRWRHRVHEIIYEAETPAGKLFDLVLLGLIIASIVAIMLESMQSVAVQYRTALNRFEWVVTILFSIEYVLRLISVRNPWAYVRSFYGVVDLLAILPTYLSLFMPGTHSLAVIRALRMLRMFRVLKLGQFLDAAGLLQRSLWASRHKIGVFMLAVTSSVVILSALIYLVEGPSNGFTSIPRALYWTVVTLTTVGYGDLTPQTPLGQTIAMFVMLLGYSIIAVPTGIVTAEIAGQTRLQQVSTEACPHCSREGHDIDATHCKWCGAKL